MSIVSILLILFFLIPVLADFAVISDIHYDMYYAEGSPTKCVLGDTGMGCCRNFSIALNGSTPAGKYGSVSCDSPISLLDLTFQWLSEQKLDYLVFLGDAVDHDLLIQNSTYNLKEINTVGDYFQHLPYPVYALMGNHDGFIVDNLWDDGSGQQWLSYINYTQPTVLGSGGYYTTVHNGIRFIFLNCLGYDTHNIEVLKYPQKDLFNQTAWFSSLIEEVKKNNETVYLFSHFGSDTSEATKEYNNKISSIDYDKITYFAGHSHSDEIRLMNSSFFYIHPSLVPSGHFPEVRIYKEKDNRIVDYLQYGLNITKPNPQFELVYTSIDSYSLPDLSPSSWIDFFNRMKTNTTLEQLYQSHASWGL